MSATADLILERRRTRRRLSLWRVIAILALVALAGVLSIRFGATGAGSKGSDHVARITVDGIILDDRRRDEMLAKIATDDRVKALVVRVNSPGGTVAGSEALYASIRAAAAGRPVVAVMAEVAASGGYVTAIAADRIFARGNTLTGSIGVVAEIPNVAGLLDMLGIEVTRLKSAPLKAEPSFTSRPTAEALAAEAELIADSFAWFRGLVAERRQLEGPALDAVADGRAFTGRQALTLGLIDQIGDERAARDWLEAERGVDADLATVDWDWSEEALPWPLNEAAAWAGAARLAGPGLPLGPRLYALIQ